MGSAMKMNPLAIASLAAAMITGACSRSHGNEMLKPGAPAPAISGVDQNGATHALQQEQGHPVVVYFYPKDATPGCTKEACAFRDVWDKYKAAGVQVFGVSGDDRNSHEKFAAAQKLPFPIIADPDHEWIEAFGVPTKLGMPSRVSFLIGPDGKIAKVYPNVDPGVHAGQVLDDAKALKI
jgi:thioredoxin-dependent peroxiredoxin